MYVISDHHTCSLGNYTTQNNSNNNNSKRREKHETSPDEQRMSTKFCVLNNKQQLNVTCFSSSTYIEVVGFFQQNRLNA